MRTRPPLTSVAEFKKVMHCQLTDVGSSSPFFVVVVRAFVAIFSCYKSKAELASTHKAVSFVDVPDYISENYLMHTLVLKCRQQACKFSTESFLLGFVLTKEKEEGETEIHCRCWKVLEKKDRL